MGKWQTYAVAVLLGLAFVNWTLWGHILGGAVLGVTFFDVGQGDAIFIETPQGHQILIDGGPDNSVFEKVGKTLPFWDKTIDLVVLTHPDADHITGLVPVLEQYTVGHVLWTGAEKNTNIFRAWQKALNNEQETGAVVWIANAPQRITFSRPASGNFDILYPFESVQGTKPKAINNTSVVAKLSYGADTFLLTGDIERSVEGELIAAGVDITADVLKTPHHGSKSSSSQSFLEAVRPKLAVIPVARNNRYGHPHEEILSRYADFGIPILQTSQEGDIVLKSSGNSF